MFVAPLGPQQGAARISYRARRCHWLVMITKLGRQSLRVLRRSEKRGSEKARVIFARCHGSVGLHPGMSGKGGLGVDFDDQD